MAIGVSIESNVTQLVFLFLILADVTAVMGELLLHNICESSDVSKTLSILADTYGHLIFLACMYGGFTESRTHKQHSTNN